MAISSNSNFNFTRDQIIRVAAQKAGVLGAGREPPADLIAVGTDLLNEGLHELQADQIILRTKGVGTLTLTAGTAEYSLPTNVIEVLEPLMLTPTSGGQLQVALIPQNQYEAISNKTSSGSPTQAYCEMIYPLKLKLWPVPDGNATTLTYPRIVLMSDMDSGSVNVNLWPRWLNTVTFQLAWKLALAYTLSLPRVQMLAMFFEKAKREAQNSDTELGPSRVSVGHRGKRW